MSDASPLESPTIGSPLRRAFHFGVDTCQRCWHSVFVMTTNRNRRTGRYTDTDFAKPCTCGHTLGEHTAERVGTEQPCLADGCDCDCFTKAKPARKGGPRYVVRKQSSGRTLSETFYAYDTARKQRVSVWAAVNRSTAQAEADRLNIGDMVKDFADDPRPYEIRYAEAEAAYRAAAK